MRWPGRSDWAESYRAGSKWADETRGLICWNKKKKKNAVSGRGLGAMRGTQQVSLRG